MAEDTTAAAETPPPGREAETGASKKDDRATRVREAGGAGTKGAPETTQQPAGQGGEGETPRDRRRRRA